MDEEGLRRMGLTPNLDKVFEAPEPQGPTTAFDRFIRDWGPGDDMEGAAYAEFREELRAVQAEARAAAPPDIDVERLAEALNATVGTFGWARTTPGDPVAEWLMNAGLIAAEYRRLASPDAKKG